MLKRRLVGIGLIGATLMLIQCMAIPLPDGFDKRWTDGRAVQLTPAEQYAGEILSYMLPVVLGREGRVDKRDAWQKRALDEQLDFKRIASKMAKAGNGKADLLVLDSNILGLSAVLYHYNRSLNQFKGRYIYDSLYPSSELVALRLLLLQKIHRAEKAQLLALVKREALVSDPLWVPDESDLHETGLNRGELRLLSEVLQSEPVFREYLKHPFLVDSFYRLGAVTKDPFVAQQIAAADYRDYPACSLASASAKGRVVIALLPSMTKEFEYGDTMAEGASAYGFKPTTTFCAATQNLQRRIVDQTIDLARRRLERTGDMAAAVKEGELQAALRKVIAGGVAFCVQDRRPLVIYPGNADRVLKSVSSMADLNIVLLGKDVYLAMEIRPDKDVYPHTNCLYLDLMDVKHNQVDEEIGLVSSFILSKLKDQLSAFADRMRSGGSGSIRVRQAPGASLSSS